MKDLTKQDVNDAMVRLINANSTTSTLEVKNDLRSLDFWAVQSNVASFMREIYNDQELEWIVNFDKGYREYSLNTVVPVTVHNFPDLPLDVSVLIDKISEITGRHIKVLKDINNADCYELEIEGVDDAQILYQGVDSEYDDGICMYDLTGNPIIDTPTLEFDILIDGLRELRAILYLNNQTQGMRPLTSIEDGGSIDEEDWAVGAPGGATLYFSEKYTRDQVRCAYRFYTNVSFNKTRAKRMKNVRA